MFRFFKTIKYSMSYKKIMLVCLVLMACNSSKKAKSTTSPATSNLSNTTVTSNTVQTEVAPNMVGPALPFYRMGVTYTPSDENLNALHTKYPSLADVSLDKLKEGHLIYTSGACIKCHVVKDIYMYDEVRWAGLIGDMSMRAHLNEIEKDALVKYIMAIKASQVKSK